MHAAASSPAARGARLALLVLALGLGTLPLGGAVRAQTGPIPPPRIYPDRGFASACLGSPKPGAGAPAAPVGLSAELEPYGPVSIVGPGLWQVHLTWDPVQDADCIAVEVGPPGSTESRHAAMAPGNATAFDVMPQQLYSAGTYCFRAFAANQTAGSAYSGEACVDVPGGFVEYAAGWNLVAGARVMAAAERPVYVYDVSTGSYAPVVGNPPAVGNGYWAYFDSPTTVPFPTLPFQGGAVAVPAGQYALVGNYSGFATAGVSGADLLYTYDPNSGTYSQTTTLAPGQGAWAFSSSGGTVTITAAP